MGDEIGGPLKGVHVQLEQVGILVCPATETSQGRLDKDVGHLYDGLEVSELWKPAVVKLASLQVAADVAGGLVLRQTETLNEFLMASDS